MSNISKVGRLTDEEIARLHPTLTEVGPRGEAVPPKLSAESIAEPKGEFVHAFPQARKGVMVMISAGGGVAVYAVDVDQWFEPLAPTLREAQVLRATTHAACRFLSSFTFGSVRLGSMIQAERAAEIVRGAAEKGLVSIHVVDVNEEAGL